MIGENNFIGKQIDTFRLITELSSGELTATYKAEQMQSSPRFVVFKLSHSVHLPEIRRERFLQEIRLLRKVKHPRILQISGGGFYENSPYIVREYVAHGSLRDRLNALTTPFLPMQEAIAIITDIGRALQFFHQINITHRNLKPENILLNDQGILLADSSITTIEDSVPVERAHNTNTFPYMAPEQFHGRANKESDQYALGCIAYELLTGIAPFAGSAFRSMADIHANEVLVPPTQLNMLLPEYIQKAILTAMAKQEAARFPHIKDFVAALTPGIRAQNVSIVALPPVIAPPSSDQHEAPILPQAQEDSAVTILQGDKPLDIPTTPTIPTIPTTPAALSINEDIQPVSPAPQEPTPVEQSPSLVATIEPPPDTPPQSVAAANNDEYPLPLETDETVAENNFFGEDIATQPDLAAVPAQSHAVASADHVLNEVEQPAIVYEAGLPIENAQAAPYIQPGKNNNNNRLPLSKNLVLSVGISWAIIAVLILSMVFIIIPSAHTLTNIVSPISQKPTPRPTLQTKPTAHPTAIPTVRPTPEPTPSPIPTPSPTATPMPTPSPSPITIPVFTVSPTSLHGPTDCQSVPFGFKCTVTLSLPQNYPGNAHWTTSSSGNITAVFVPSHGTLSPGQQQTVNIFLGKNCPRNSSLIFSTENTKAVVSWSC